MYKKKPWTEPELRRLAHFYQHLRCRDLVPFVHHPLASIYGKAGALGLEKSEAFKSSSLAYGPIVETGKQYRFKKGNVPANKGIKGWQAGGRSKETQFKKGHRNQLWKPIGAERITKDGYLQRKVTDTGYTPRDWQGVHILLWVEHNGPVPAGHCVIFKNKNKTDIRIENLELISRGELARRNQMHRYLDNIKQLIYAKRSLTRAINKRMKNEEQDRRSA